VLAAPRLDAGRLGGHPACSLSAAPDSQRRSRTVL